MIAGSCPHPTPTTPPPSHNQDSVRCWTLLHFKSASFCTHLPQTLLVITSFYRFLFSAFLFANISIFISSLRVDVHPALLSVAVEAVFVRVSALGPRFVKLSWGFCSRREVNIPAPGGAAGWLESLKSFPVTQNQGIPRRGLF